MRLNPVPHAVQDLVDRVGHDRNLARLHQDQGLPLVVELIGQRRARDHAVDLTLVERRELTGLGVDIDLVGVALLEPCLAQHQIQSVVCCAAHPRHRQGKSL